MDRKKLGFKKLVEVIGENFYEEHKTTACFSYGDTEHGLYCFLGIDLHPENTKSTLSANIEDWDIYASCYVTETDIVMDKCKLP